MNTAPLDGIKVIDFNNVQSGPSCPCKFSDYSTDYRPAPELVENTKEILTSLGYSDDQINELSQKGTI